jgi:hypothetical protein
MIRLQRISCVKIGIRSRETGGSGRTDVLHFRASDPAELREQIEQQFPQAVFSQESPGLTLKEQHAQEVKAGKETASKQAGELDFARRVTVDLIKEAAAPAEWDTSYQE